MGVIKTYDTSSVPTVEKFMQSNKFLRYIQGPFGSGKSTGSVQEILQRGMIQPIQSDGVIRSRFAIVRGTYPQLRDSTIKTFLDWFPDKVWGTYKTSPMPEYHMRFQRPDEVIVEIEVLFRALERPDQISNLLSVEYTGAWFNEMRDIPFEIFKAMQGRVGRYPAVKDGGCTWNGIWGDSNPPDTDHWIYRVFEEEKPDNAEAFYQPSGLSPDAENTPNLKKGYYEEMAKGADPDWVRVYIDGEYGFVREGKPVYHEYNDQTHCQEFEYQPNLPIYRGWDFGRTPSCVFAQISNNRLFVIDEVTSEGMGIEDFADIVLDHTKQEYPFADIRGDYGDPAGTRGDQISTNKTPFSVMWEKNIFIEEGIQDLDVRLSTVKSRLTKMVDGQPALVLHPRCRTLRKGFIGGYALKRLNVSGERYAEKPDKGKYSHVQDALQYLCTRLFAVNPVNSGRRVRVVGKI